MIPLSPKTIIAAACALILILVGSSATLALSEKPVLSITPDEIDFGVVRNTAVKSRSIAIGGRGRITWMVKWVEPWLRLDTYSGVVEDDVRIISVRARPRDLPLGRYQSEIVLATSSGTRTVPVSITVLQGSDEVAVPRLEKIALVPPVVAAQTGRKVHLRAVGVYSDGSRRDITGEVQWISENKRVGEFLEKKGLLNVKSAGNVRVFAKEGRVMSPVMTIPVDSLDGPLLKVYLPKITLDHMEKGSMETLSLSLRNAGAGDLEWEVISRSSWLVVEGNTPWGGRDEEAADRVNSEPIRSDMPGKARSAYGSLRGMGEKRVKVTVDTTGLPEGAYEGSILIRSNGGDEEITVPITVLSLASISLAPVSVKMAVNDRMLFRTTGIWSDGSRTDLSTGSGGRWVISDPSIGFFLRRRPVFIAGRPGLAEIRREKGAVSSNAAVVVVEEDPLIPVLLISSHEVDFGTIGPGEVSKGDISLKNVGGGDLVWQTHEIEGWTSPGETVLSGTAGRSGRRLRISVESNGEAFSEGLFAVRIRLEAEHNSVFYEKFLSVGTYREELRLNFNGGERSVFLKFTVAGQASRANMDIYPLGMDFGSVAAEGTLMKKIELRNLGKNVLKWDALLQGNRRMFRGVVPERGRYVSFANETLAGKGRYRVPERLKGEVAISGE